MNKHNFEKSLKLKAWLGLAWLGLAWLGLIEIYFSSLIIIELYDIL